MSTTSDAISKVEAVKIFPIAHTNSLACGGLDAENSPYQ